MWTEAEAKRQALRNAYNPRRPKIRFSSEVGRWILFYTGRETHAGVHYLVQSQRYEAAAQFDTLESALSELCRLYFVGKICRDGWA